MSNNKDNGLSTRIIIGWNANQFDVGLIDFNDQVSHCKIKVPKGNQDFFCSFVYAANKYSDRRILGTPFFIIITWCMTSLGSCMVILMLP